VTLALAIAAAGCSSATSGVDLPSLHRPSPTGGSSPAPAVGPGPSEVEVPDLLRFEAPGLDGNRVRGADYAGRDLAIWFWAPW
jgi:hypothetical protein